METRRSAPRHNAGWPGRYRFDNLVGGESHACLVVDISDRGAGLECFGPVPSYVVGIPLVVEIGSPIGTSVVIKMVGELRNASPGSRGGLRVGMEFLGLTPTECAILHALESMHVGS
jgi:hypothetical protein